MRKRICAMVLVPALALACVSFAFAACKPQRSVTCVCMTGGVGQQYVSGQVNPGGIGAGHTAICKIKVTVYFKWRGTNKPGSDTTGWLTKRAASKDVPAGLAYGVGGKTDAAVGCAQCKTSTTGTARDTW